MRRHSRRHRAGGPRRPRAGGQGLVEYGLIVSLSSALTFVWLFAFGNTISDALSFIGAAIERATGG